MKHILPKACLIFIIGITTANLTAGQVPPRIQPQMTIHSVGTELLHHIATNNRIALNHLLNTVAITQSEDFYRNAVQVVLMQATFHNNPTFVYDALQRNVNVNYRNPHGKTALTYAIANNNTKIIALLLNAGAVCTWPEKVTIIKLNIQKASSLATKLAASLVLLEFYKNYSANNLDNTPPRSRL